MPIASQLDNPHLWMLVRGNLGQTALLNADLEAARSAFREELELCRDLDFLPFVCEGLRGFAALAAVAGDLDRAARLHGAADTHRYGQPEDEVDARLEAEFFGDVRGRPARADGAALSLDDAIEYALAG